MPIVCCQKLSSKVKLGEVTDNTARGCLPKERSRRQARSGYPYGPRSKDNYLGAQFRRLTARRGKKRAAVAVARSILVIVYHVIQDGTEYVDWGGDYIDKRNQAQIERRLIKRLEQLGHKVILEPCAAT